jgi:hypothetical protein
LESVDNIEESRIWVKEVSYSRMSDLMDYLRMRVEEGD